MLVSQLRQMADRMDLAHWGQRAAAVAFGHSKFMYAATAPAGDLFGQRAFVRGETYVWSTKRTGEIP